MKSLNYKFFIPLIWTLILGFPSMALSNTDSLLTILPTLPEDSSKVKVLNDISYDLFRTHADSALIYSESAQKLAESIGFYAGKAQSLKNQGLSFYVKGDFIKVLSLWEASLETYEEMDAAEGISNLSNNIGAVYYNQGNYPKALEYYLESLRYAEQIDHKLRTATALQNIGAVYEKNSDTKDKAIDYYQRALVLVEELDAANAIGTVSSNLGDNYLDMKLFGKAHQSLNKGIEYLSKIKGNIAYPLMVKGEVYAAEGDFDSAIRYLEQSYNYALKIDAKLEMARALDAMGATYAKKGDHTEAIDIYGQAADLLQELGGNEELKDTYQGLSQSYAVSRNFRKAYEYEKLYGSIKDTLFNIENSRRIEGLQFEFEIEKKEDEIALLNADNKLQEAEIKQANTMRNFSMAAVAAMLLVLGGIIYQLRYVKKTNAIITEERNRSNELLLNILPEETARELKENGFVKAKKYDHVSVLFTDFKSFSKHAEHISPEELVKSIDFYFREYDRIFEKHNLEKIKTIGDAYMCGGGLPKSNTTNQVDAINAAKEIISFMNGIDYDKLEGIIKFDVRIGIHTGPVVAGVVGTTKFQYDIWGDAVNVASRMETSCDPGRINVSGDTYELVKDLYEFEYRGEIEVKNRGEIKMYYVKG